MKIGCGAQIDELLLVKDLGFDYVELRGKSVAALDDMQFQALLDTLTAQHLACPSLNAYCGGDIVIAGPGYDRDAHRRYAKTLAGRAAKLGVQVVGVGSPASRILPEGFDQTLAWTQALDFMDDIADCFTPYGIRVGFEALGHCFCNFINHIAQAAELAGALAEKQVGVVLDFYNMEQSGEGDLDVSVWCAQILHAHISDDHGACTWRSFLDRDRYPVHAARVSRLLAAGYTGNLTLEVDEPLSGSAAADSLAFLRSVADGYTTH